MYERSDDIVSGSEKRQRTRRRSWSLCGNSLHDTGGCFDLPKRGMLGNFSVSI
jgi:hypothetical protein